MIDDWSTSSRGLANSGLRHPVDAAKDAPALSRHQVRIVVSMLTADIVR
jgi:hypothetical protein